MEQYVLQASRPSHDAIWGVNWYKLPHTFQTIKSFPVQLKKIDSFYHNTPEPERSVFLALSNFILSMDANISTDLKYGMPFFSYKNKMCCYLWKDKKTNEPYIGIVEGNRIQHPALEKGKRSRMKILRVDPKKDIDIEIIGEVMAATITLYKNGYIKTK